MMMARAMETRRRIPPESSEGNFWIGVFECDELERFDDSTVNLLFGDMIFVKTVGNVVSDREGVEES